MRHGICQSAVTPDFTRMQPVINDADTQEQCARNKPMTEHDKHRAFDPLPVECEQADGHEGHVRDA